MNGFRGFLLSLLVLCGSALALDLHVATDGNDAWSGKLAAPNAERTDGPFATLTRARDEARKHPGEPRTIHIGAGTYAITETLKFEPQDSGTAEAPVLWRGFKNEKPTLIGGRTITGWKPWKGEILQADVGAQGFKGIPFTQLFSNGRRQHLARYPNFDPQNPYGGGWAYVEGDYWPMYAEKPGEDKQTLHVKPQDWRNWARPEEVQVFIFPRYNWWNNIVRVKSVDAEKRIVTTAQEPSYAMRPGDRYFFQGALEELDAPGEWYLDQRSWTLYFWPLKVAATFLSQSESDRNVASTFAPTTRDILSLTGTSHVTFRGFTIECAEGSAIVMKDARHCRVEACTVRNVGDYSGTGIAINGGEQNGVIGCDVHDTGSSAISLNGGDRKTLKPAGHFAENCYIHHPGVFYKQGVGVGISGVGQRVSHCLIHDTPRFAIQFTGNNHTLEFNHLRHLALETEDVGATYCGGRDWISPRGTVIRHNFIHDVLGCGIHDGKIKSPYFAWGIYLDDNSGGVDVIGNIVARCGRSLIHGHSARDSRVENNIFIEGGQRQWEFNGWTTQHRFWTDHFPSMVKGYESVVNEPAWKDVRGMKLHPKDAPDAEGRVMSGNVFQRNIIAWKNPGPRALNVVAFDSSRNDFDHNLYWHHGQPLLTGVKSAGKAITGNLAPNPGFEEGEPGKLPRNWSWQIRPRPDATAALVEDEGRRVLRIDAAINKEKPRDNYPIVTSRELELKPGASYRLRGKLRSDRDGAKSALMLQCWIPPAGGEKAHFWASNPSGAKVSAAWKDLDFTFTIPARGENGWHEKMRTFRIRLDWNEETGSLFADDIVLEEIEMMSDWASWQALGGDRHSIIADPKFVAPEKNDYRLQPDSPAWKLGFKPIPVERIGPYQSDLRASWPIVEAEGAREKPIAP